MNRFLAGAAALGVRPQESIGWSDWDWRTIFYDPAGGAYRYLNQSDRTYQGGAPANAYWGQNRQTQRSGVAPTFNQQRQQSGQQLRDVLLQQQAANTAALQRQLAQLAPGGAGIAPSPYGATPPQQPTFAADPYSTGTPSDPYGGYGSDTVVGAKTDQASSQFPPGTYVVVRVKNMPDVIRAQSALGKLALMGTPQTIQKIAYGKMADEFRAKLAENGVDADVVATEQPPKAPLSGMDVTVGMGLGAASVGLVWLLVKMLRRR